MRRYAIYAVPGAGSDDTAEALALKATVAAWYARADLHDLAVNARRYGFHATLAAPFHLAAAHTEAELLLAATAFAAERATVTIPGLRPTAMGSFRALVPSGDQKALNALGESVVRKFDGFRAPLTEADVRRRRASHLTARQRELFDRWGYPYVLDEFRFHLTLTDELPAERAAAVDAAAAQHFALVAGVDVPLSGITISVEPEPGAAFEIISVHPFTPSFSIPRFALETA
jgi:hypothetical protein